jgi:hypothetical protein
LAEDREYDQLAMDFEDPFKDFRIEKIKKKK